MQASLAGDSRAHRALFVALIPVLRRYFARNVSNNADVDDLVQVTLIAVHDRRDTYDPARPFKPWLFAVARYKLVDQFRRTRRHLALDDVDEIADLHDFGEDVDARVDIETQLATLSSKQAVAVRATRIEGLSIAETAARYGLSPSDVKISVHRGLKALARRVLGQ